MEELIRLGFVGARFAAEFHWQGIRRVYGVPVEIVGVMSRTPEARDAFAREKGIQTFDSFDEMCAAVNVVDICTPPSSHEELAIRALNLGKHVIIEKPLTGYYGGGAEGFHGSSYPKEQMLREATASCARILPQRSPAASASVMQRIGSMPQPSRRSGTSLLRAVDRFFGCWVNSRTVARIRLITACGSFLVVDRWLGRDATR